MSKEIKDGGPAFPTENGRQISNDGFIHEGMTLRDYFAAKAMQGFCANEGWVDLGHIAASAYQVADAMLEARGRN